MKTRNEIRTEMLAVLARKTGINITEEGSVALAIVDALLDEVVSLYHELERTKQGAYLSTSSGVTTELIGELMGITRREGESDANLKVRIGNATHTHAKGNRIAIEEAIWSVPGVANFDYRPYGQGTGSFTVYLYPQPGVNQVRLLEQVRLALKDAVAEGIRYEVRVPAEKRIDLSLVLQFKEGTSVMQKQELKNRARANVTAYINNLQKGGVLTINEIIKRVMALGPEVVDLGFAELKVGGVQKSISNTFPESDTRFVAGTIHIL